MKNLIERIKAFTQNFLRTAVSILANNFADDKPVPIPIRIRSTSYNDGKRDLNRH